MTWRSAREEITVALGDCQLTGEPFTYRHRLLRYRRCGLGEAYPDEGAMREALLLLKLKRERGQHPQQR
jgi:hypothetical protein